MRAIGLVATGVVAAAGAVVVVFAAASARDMKRYLRIRKM